MLSTAWEAAADTATSEPSVPTRAAPPHRARVGRLPTPVTAVAALIYPLDLVIKAATPATAGEPLGTDPPPLTRRFKAHAKPRFHDQVPKIIRGEILVRHMTAYNSSKL